MNRRKYIKIAAASLGAFFSGCVSIPSRIRATKKFEDLPIDPDFIQKPDVITHTGELPKGYWRADWQVSKDHKFPENMVINIPIDES